MRVAWVMRLKPGNEAIYKQKHDEIWPEMLELMQRQGIRNYSIYRYGLTLFAYLERDAAAAARRAARSGRAPLVEDDGAVHGIQRRRHALAGADRGNVSTPTEAAAPSSPTAEDREADATSADRDHAGRLSDPRHPFDEKGRIDEDSLAQPGRVQHRRRRPRPRRGDRQRDVQVQRGRARAGDAPVSSIPCGEARARRDQHRRRRHRPRGRLQPQRRGSRRRRADDHAAGLHAGRSRRGARLFPRDFRGGDDPDLPAGHAGRADLAGAGAAARRANASTSATSRSRRCR